MTAQQGGETALKQLAAVPGVVGGLVFDENGDVTASAFPPVFDEGGLRNLAQNLAGDGYFQQWMSGDSGTLDLRYADGNVLVRTVDHSWLLVLSTAQSNPQLLQMSVTQVLRRLRSPGAVRTGELPLKPVTGEAAPSVLDRLRAVVADSLGQYADQGMEILNAAGPKQRDLVRAAADIEKLTRLFIDKKKAEEIGRRMRDILDV